MVITTIKDLLQSDYSTLVSYGKSLPKAQQELFSTLIADPRLDIYDPLIHEKLVRERIETAGMNLSQYSTTSEEIIPVFAFLQSFAKQVISLLLDTSILHTDPSLNDRKNNFLDECNQKIFSSEVLKVIAYNVSQFNHQFPDAVPFLYAFVEVANAAGISFFLHKYELNPNLLNKTEEERQQRWKERVEHANLRVDPKDGLSPKEVAESIATVLKDRDNYLKQN